MKSYVCITGAACGLDKALAAECTSRGWNLFLTDVSDGALIPLATGLERLYGVEIRYYACDLTDPASREALWQHANQLSLRFHFLINVAGVDFEGPFNERNADELRAIVRLNVAATVEMTRGIELRRCRRANYRSCACWAQHLHNAQSH